MSAGEIEVVGAGPADDHARDELVHRLPRATFFHLSGWGRVVERVMRHRRRDLLARRGGELVGVLPLMACRGLRSTSLISVPYAVYGGAAGVDAEVERALHDAAQALAQRERVGRLELRCRHEPGLDLVPSDLYATFIRELPERVEDVLAGMPKKARAEARKARQKHGLSLHAGEWYLPDLARLFHRNKHGLGSPSLPRRMFEELLREFPGQSVVHVVRQGGAPISAVMSFLFRDEVLAYYAGTDQGADRLYSASNFMYLALQEWSIAQGYRTFDFGRSRRDSGAFRFKERQGFQGADLHYRFQLVKDLRLPSMTPSNPKTRIPREIWKRLPSGLAKALSGPLSRYLP